MNRKIIGIILSAGVLALVITTCSSTEWTSETQSEKFKFNEEQYAQLKSTTSVEDIEVSSTSSVLEETTNTEGSASEEKKESGDSTSLDERDPKWQTTPTTTLKESSTTTTKQTEKADATTQATTRQTTAPTTQATTRQTTASTTQATTRATEPTTTPTHWLFGSIEDQTGNSGRIFTIAEYGSDRAAARAALDWGEGQLFDKESPYYLKGFESWSVIAHDSSIYGYTVDFY